MNLKDPKYNKFALVNEMLETPGLIGKFDYSSSKEAAAAVRDCGRLFLTGEGSSRIFPAKNLITEVLSLGMPLAVATEGARQAHEYDLSKFVVFGASNSGKTKELISLFNRLCRQGHQKRFGLSANSPCTLETVSNRCYTLQCGKEDAVAATKSVVEQALFYLSLVFTAGAASPLVERQQEAAVKARDVLEAEIDPALIQRIAEASTVYFAGRNNGVAEEITLKTNEITHKKSDYLEGTYAVHGIEEVMTRDDVVIVFDPFPEEIEKFKTTLVDGVGLTVIVIAPENSTVPAIVPTITIPRVEGYWSILQLLAGWNILVQVGVGLGINLDKAERARKIGNEFLGE